MELLEFLEKLELLENQKSWDEILSLSDEAIESYPYSLSIKTYKVKALIKKEKLDLAKELCFDLIKSNPGSSVIHSLLASIYERSGEINKAIDEYNKILFLNPGDTETIKEIERLKNVSGKMSESDLSERSKSETLKETLDNEKEIAEEEKKVDSQQKERDDSYSVSNESEINKEIDFDDQHQIEKEISVDVSETDESEDSEKQEKPEDKIDETYATYTMANLLESQEKLDEARQIYKKLYLSSSDKKALRGYKRTGLKKLLKILNNYLLRGKPNE